MKSPKSKQNTNRKVSTKDDKYLSTSFSQNVYPLFNFFLPKLNSNLITSKFPGFDLRQPTGCFARNRKFSTCLKKIPSQIVIVRVICKQNMNFCDFKNATSFLTQFTIYSYIVLYEIMLCLMIAYCVI